MSGMLQALLALPPCLRRQVSSPPFTVKRASLMRDLWPPITGQRDFTHTSRKLAGSARVLPRPRPSVRASRPAPAPRPPPPRPLNKAPPYAERLLSTSKGSPVLLYRSPSHTSFRVTSYALGGIILLGAYIYAGFTYRPPEEVKLRTPWYIKTLSGGVCIFMAVMATAFILAPTKLIRTVTLVSKSSLGPMLRFQMKRPVPFMQPKTIEAKPDDVFMDRSVTASSRADILFTSIPLVLSETFTSTGSKPIKRGFVERLAAFNRSLLYLWPRFRRDVKRMFLRDGMAYVRITGEGNWKLDLQGCVLLDQGQPLERLTIADPNVKDGLVGIFKRYFLR